MVSLIVIGVIVATALAGVAPVAGKSELEVVRSVDLARYAGRWYEIARLPNRFEKKCVDSVTATYTLRSDGRVDVVNRCRKANGEYSTAKGKAKVVDKGTNAKLKVTFFWPFYGDYWILDLGSNYEYAVVGSPNRDYLWILSRTPQLDEQLYQSLIAKMATRGFETDRMIRTSQPAELGQTGAHSSLENISARCNVGLRPERLGVDALRRCDRRRPVTFRRVFEQVA